MPHLLPPANYRVTTVCMCKAVAEIFLLTEGFAPAVVTEKIGLLKRQSDLFCPVLTEANYELGTSPTVAEYVKMIRETLADIGSRWGG